jgi:antitoxin ParD1/3/4
MGTNVHLTPELEQFAQACVRSGRFNSVSEVLRSGLRLLQDAEQRRTAFTKSLDEARAEGLTAGLSSLEDVEADARSVIAAARRRAR